MSVQILGTFTQNERLGSFCVVNHPTIRRISYTTIDNSKECEQKFRILKESSKKFKNCSTFWERAEGIFLWIDKIFAPCANFSSKKIRSNKIFYFGFSLMDLLDETRHLIVKAAKKVLFLVDSPLRGVGG